MKTEKKHLDLSNLDTFSFGSPLNTHASHICELFILLEEKLIERDVLSLPLASLTEVMIERLEINTDNSVRVSLEVTADFDDINSFCKACENSRDIEADILEQVKTLIQSIRDCDL